MNPTIGWIRALAESWGVPAVLVPLVPFLVLLIVLYAVIGLAAYGAKRKWPRADKTIAFWLFISPWLIGFLVFTVGPMISSIFVSLTSWDLITPPRYVGFANYTEAVQDPRVALDKEFPGGVGQGNYIKAPNLDELLTLLRSAYVEAGGSGKASQSGDLPA